LRKNEMKNPSSLIEKALSRPAKRISTIPSTQEVDLALAWLRGEITTGQAHFAMGKTKASGNVLYRIAISLRRAYQLGRLSIKR